MDIERIVAHLVLVDAALVSYIKALPETTDKGIQNRYAYLKDAHDSITKAEASLAHYIDAMTIENGLLAIMEENEKFKEAWKFHRQD